MGRTSRRTNVAPVEKSRPASMLFPTAIYARLSDKNSGKDDDGAALENQIEVCKEYINQSEDLKLFKVYQDNGWTGTNMNRPQFEEMLKDIRAGKIKTVLVRDLSRFSRDYIETGMYLEKIFPRLDIRFISVKEQFDSFTFDGDNDSLRIALQSLLNALYSKDISRKIHATYDVQKRDKTFSWRAIPYGYMWNDDHTSIVPDPESADIIRQIFDLRISGLRSHNIAKTLDERGVPTYIEKKTGTKKKWNPASVRDILKNPAYIGNKVWGRRKAEFYKGISKHWTPEDEWIVIENSHEPLVSKEIFDKVQELQAEGRKKYAESTKKSEKIREKFVNNLPGKVFCSDCGRVMRYRRSASNGRERKPSATYNNQTCYQTNGCQFRTMAQTKLERIVVDSINSQIRMALDMDETISQMKNSIPYKDRVQEYSQKLKSFRGEIARLQDKRTRLYEDYVEGILSQEDYLYAKTAFDEEYEYYNEQLTAATAEYEQYRENMSSDNKWISMLRGLSRSKKLTRELADAVIDKIYLYKGGGVEIVLKYNDIFRQTEKSIAELGGAADEG